MVILGFDPGGAHHFGWCVADAKDGGKLQLRASGVGSHAVGVVTAALEEAGDHENITAAGIDSPVFWVAGGDRKADKLIRSAMKRADAVNIGGTIQHVNALRGACLIQGTLWRHASCAENCQRSASRNHTQRPSCGSCVLPASSVPLRTWKSATFATS